MSRLRKVIRPLCHLVHVSSTLIVMALLLFVSYENIKKRSVHIPKSLQQETSLQFKPALETIQKENSTVFMLGSADNHVKPEAFGAEGTKALPGKEGKKEEIDAVRRFRTRKEKVLEACRNKELNVCNFRGVQNYRTYYFHRYNTSVCILAKSASSTWRAHLRMVNGGPPFNESMRNDKIREAFILRPTEEVLEYINSTAKILTVRHPLTRLVSAFREKYNKGKIMTPHRPLIEAEIRTRIAGSSWAERFHQFWLPALFANNMVPPNTHLKVGMKAPIDPKVFYSEEEYERLYLALKPKITFVQFLKYALKTYEEGDPDAHWKAYYKCCCACYFDYDFITKVETLSADLEYVFKKLGIPADPHISKNQLRESVDNIYSYFEYYRNVPATLRRDIYKYIKPDMDLFGYELPENFLI